MKVAITGARGRLGKELRRYCQECGHEVTGFSRNPDATHQPLSLFGRALEKEPFEAVVHLAWSTVPSSAEIHPGIEWREDLPLLSAMLSDLDVLRANGKPAPSFVFFSSCAVYGEASEDAVVFDEKCPPRPIGWYARAKTQAEELISAFAQRGNAAAVLRVTNPYGYLQDERCLQGVVPAIIRAALNGGEFTVWGTDEAVKDYLHISDLCRAVDRVLTAGLRGTYNVASGHSASLRELIGSVESIIGRKVKRKTASPAAWDVRRGRYSNQAFQAVADWTPQVALDEGLADYISMLQKAGPS